MAVGENVMSFTTVEISDDRGYGPSDPLFERVGGFRFVGNEPGFMQIRAITTGAIRVAEVLSSGHDVAPDNVRGVTFLAPITGRIAADTGHAHVETAAGGGLVLQPGDRETFVRADGRQGFRALVAIADLPEPALHGMSSTVSPDMMQRDAARGLRGFLQYLFAEVTQPDSPLLRPASLRAVEALVIDGMSALQGLGTPRRVDDTEVPVTRVQDAVAYIRAHADEPLTIAHVAQAVGIGTRTLHAAFRQHLGTTPRTMLSDIRLERVRARLLAPDPCTTVSTAALQSGFAHLGRFAATYRRRYGESPSQTLRRSPVAS